MRPVFTRPGARLAHRLWRAIDNTRIAAKVMLAPAVAIIALVLLFGATLHTFHADESHRLRIDNLRRHWLNPMTSARLCAASLQSNLLRLSALGQAGATPEQKRAAAERILRDDAQLQSLLQDPPGRVEAADARADLLAAYRAYRGASADAVTSFLKNPDADASKALTAADALDGVIAGATALRSAGIHQIQAGIASGQAFQALWKHTLYAVMAAGSTGAVLASMLVGWRIATPLRALTAAMARLADRRYDTDIPATAQNDEVGSMARAVLLLRERLIRAESTTTELQATKKLLDTVLTHLPIPIVVKDAATLKYVLVNPAAAEIGPGARRACGQTVGEVLSAVDAAGVQAADLAALASGGLTVQRDVKLFAGTPHQRIADLMRMLVPGSGDEPRYLITAMIDLTDRRRSEQRLALMAQYEGLAGLPSRHRFTEHVGEALERERDSKNRIAVLALHLDLGNGVNHAPGAPADDELRRIVTARLHRCLRGGDAIAPLEGNAFGIIQHDVTSPVDTEDLATRLIACLREPFELDGQEIVATVSVGCALGNGPVAAAELVEQADLALNDAKRAGGGVFRFFAPKLSLRLHQRRAMEADLRTALRSGQLSLQYQPSVELSTGAIVGTEALMRWKHPIDGTIPPSTFIPLAEEIGLIGPLGMWLVDEACHEAASWAAPIRIAVNVSPIQLRTPGFAAHVQQALLSSGLAPDRVELEITEGVLLRDSAEILAILRNLHDIGVRIALDDFGTGYASLAYLHSFAFDKLKIDRSFVKNIETDPTALAIMRAILGLSNSLNMTTTAEGIEAEAQADLLRILGCSEAQGYLFWRPMPAPALRALLQKMPPSGSFWPQQTPIKECVFEKNPLFG